MNRKNDTDFIDYDKNFKIIIALLFNQEYFCRRYYP